MGKYRSPSQRIGNKPGGSAGGHIEVGARGGLWRRPGFKTTWTENDLDRKRPGLKTTWTENEPVMRRKTFPYSTASRSICSNRTRLSEEESRERDSEPPGTSPTFSRYWEFDMRRPWHVQVVEQAGAFRPQSLRCGRLEHSPPGDGNNADVVLLAKALRRVG